jgi:hypothetical protein
LGLLKKVQNVSGKYSRHEYQQQECGYFGFGEMDHFLLFFVFYCIFM